MPWPCTCENILGGVDITVSDRPAERTDMSSHRQRFLHNLTALVAVLRGETRVHSDDLMSSTLSLHFKNVEKRAPTGVHDALSQGMVLDHVENTQLLNSDDLIAFYILLCRLIVEVTALPLDLEMGLRRTASGFTASMRTLLASTYRSLLTSQGLLQGAIEARVLDGMSFRVSQENCQTNVKTNFRMGTLRWFMRSSWLHLTYKECIPMPIGPMYQMNRLRHAFYRTMQLDLEEMSQLLRDNKMFLVFMHIAIFAVLSELDRMPAVRLLETGETNTRNGMLLGGKETFERFGEPISQHLYCGGRYMLTLSLESSFQVIVAWKCVLVLILLLNRLKHAIIHATRLTQAGLF